MGDLLKKIYTEVISREEDSLELDRGMENEIQQIVDNYNEKLTADELEELRNHFYYISLLAKQKGVHLGMKYTLKIAISLLTDS